MIKFIHFVLATKDAKCGVASVGEIKTKIKNLVLTNELIMVELSP